MFKAVNTESEAERKKALQEKKKIQDAYLLAMKTHNFSAYLEIKVVFEENLKFFSIGRENLLLHDLVMVTPVKELGEVIEKYGIFDCRTAFFEAIKRYIDNGDFIKARKYLNVAGENGLYCNDYFDLENRIKTEYFPGSKIDKKCKFEDFL